MPSDETMVVNDETGGRKGSKMERFDLIPAGPLRKLAEHYGRGSRKYEDRNWERGYKWSLSFAALQRHAWAFWHGETYDPEFCEHDEGEPHRVNECVEHMVAVAWHAFALLEFNDRHPALDDRPGVSVEEILSKTGMSIDELNKLVGKGENTDEG